MKKNKRYFSSVLILIFVLTSFMAMPATVSAATAKHEAVTIETPFEAYDLSQGETKTWTVPLSLSGTSENPMMDIMYVVDTSNSMVIYEESLSKAIGALGLFTEQLMVDAADINFGVAFFGDSEVDHPWFGIKLELGEHGLEEIKDTLTTLPRPHGGDNREDSLWAYMRTIAETEWRENAQHVVVLITDVDTKIRQDQIVTDSEGTEYHVTLVDASVLADAKDIDTVLMSLGSISLIGDIAAALGVDEYFWESQAELQAQLAAAIIPPTGASSEYNCEARIESVTYKSDGATSTDVDITVTPERFTLREGETKQFDFIATAAENPARYSDTTVVEIGYYIDGVRIDKATQMLYYRVGQEIVQDAEWIMTDKDDGYGIKITSNAQSYDAGEGVVFNWNTQQKTEGKLSIPEAFFEKYTSLTIVVKASNEYRKMTVTEPGVYDVTTWANEKGKEHNIDMIWLQFND